MPLPASSSVHTYPFGTSGYRSDTPEGFNPTVVACITASITDYLIEAMHRTGKALPVLIGGDTREKTKMAIPLIIKQLLDCGLDVLEVAGDVPTPVLALLARDTPEGPTAGAILMTASHNPWPYGGYNFITPDAAIVSTAVSAQFVSLQQNPKGLVLNRALLGLSSQPTHQVIDPYPLYQQHLQTGLGLQYHRIKEANIALFYDPMYATGRTFFPRLLAEQGIALTTLHNTERRPANYQGMPEPSAEHLTELATLVSESGRANPLTMGLANDGDADRFGVMDETGRTLNPNEVLALTLYHLIHHRSVSTGGVVVRSQATSHRLDAMAQAAGYSILQTPVGYKYIAEVFIAHAHDPSQAPVILGGESSGGLSIGGHIPEKDGLLANLLMVELVATEQRPLTAILDTINGSLSQQFVFTELALQTPDGKAILDFAQQLQRNGIEGLSGFTVDSERTQTNAQALLAQFGTQDGVKLYFTNGAWLLLRASGTEPLVRVYLEAVGDQASTAQATANALQSWITEQLTQRFTITSIKQKT
jgi:phosphomannomutase